MLRQSFGFICRDGPQDFPYAFFVGSITPPLTFRRQNAYPVHPS